MRLSGPMHEILLACARSREGIAWIADLVRERVARGESVDTARSSLSRTVKRLQRLGLAAPLGKWDGADFRRARRVWLTLEGWRWLASSRRVRVDRRPARARRQARGG